MFNGLLAEYGWRGTLKKYQTLNVIELKRPSACILKWDSHVVFKRSSPIMIGREGEPRAMWFANHKLNIPTASVMWNACSVYYYGFWANCLEQGSWPELILCWPMILDNLFSTLALNWDWIFWQRDLGAQEHYHQHSCCTRYACHYGNRAVQANS